MMVASDIVSDQHVQAEDVATAYRAASLAVQAVTWDSFVSHCPKNI